MTTRTWITLGALCAAAIANASPDCLIFQIDEPLVGDTNPNYLLAPFVADELDKDGRVRPVVWSLTDPVFREWTSKDVFRNFDSSPDLPKVQEAARKLGVKYVLAVRAYRHDQQVFAIGELYVNGRSAWRFGPRKADKSKDIVIQSDGKYDEAATKKFMARLPDAIKAGGTFAVFQNGVVDLVETSRAVASTWAALLADGPLKSLPARPRITEADNPTNLDTPDMTGPKGSASEDVLAEVKELTEKGDFHRALLLLREVCDRKPFDLKVRVALVETLSLAGMPEEAAQAAQVATQLNPDDFAIWLMAARCWIASADADKASQNLTRAIEKGAIGPELIETQGDLALLQGDLKLAMGKFGQLKGNRSSLRQAIAMALTGDSTGCTKVLSERGETPLGEDDYRTIILFVERGLLKLSDQSRAIIPTIRIHPGEPETMTQVTDFSNVSGALSALIAAINPPAIHKESHEARKLAHILLAQASLEALGFAKNNDPELAEEAAATLGQAFRLFPGVREKFALERKYGST